MWVSYGELLKSSKIIENPFWECQFLAVEAHSMEVERTKIYKAMKKTFGKGMHSAFLKREVSWRYCGSYQTVVFVGCSLQYSKVLANFRRNEVATKLF